MTRQNRIMLIVAACGAAATPGLAQPFVITGSGATLQANFFRSPAATNDFIDVDGDLQAGSLGSLFPDQLAPLSGSGHWFIHYRILGSGNGIAELDTFSTIFDQEADNTDDDANTTPNNDQGNSAFTDDAIWNRNDLVIARVLQFPLGESDHRSGMPMVPNADNGYEAQALNLGDPDNGFTVDFAAADVPLAWFAILDPRGSFRPDATPGSPGYGGNPRIPTDKTGAPVPFDNLLRPLSVLNTDVQSPDANTVYEFALAQTPVAASVNYGVGKSEILMSDLRHLAATGRLLTGENLEKICRDSGSGTRNAFMNGIGLDPSWGVGENVGDRATSDSASDRVGPNYQPSNKSGSSRMDATVQNVRLAIGHTGAERGATGSSPASFMTLNRNDVLAVVSDLKGGVMAARPNHINTNDGGPDGYNVTGPAGISTRGDFRSVSADLGGWGWDPAEVGPMPADYGPPTPNAQAGAFVNNIRRSIAEFVEVPAGIESDFMPGERVAQLFLLNASPDFVSEINPSTPTQPIPLIANPDLNPNVQNFSLNDPSNVLRNAVFQSFDFATTGTVPTRTTGVTYTDGVVGGGSYVRQSGGAIAYGGDGSMPRRNKIAYDFNGDGVRSAADVTEMLEAIIDREGGADWVAPAGSGALLDTTGDGVPDGGVTAPGGDACPEILGDGNSDGNFNREDVRYWADGLVLADNNLDILPVLGVDSEGGDGIIDSFVVGDGADDQTLDRRAGFEAVDNAWFALTGNDNFFGTVIGDGSISYVAGASRADVAGSGGVTRGWAPIGADGVVDQDDVDYILANFGDWTDLNQAVNIDLSCDMNADLVVDQDDVNYVLGLLGELGCNDADLAVPYGTLDFSDVIAFLTAFGSMDASADLAPPFGTFDFSDVISFLTAFGAGCP